MPENAVSWYVAINAKPLGPLTLEEVQSLIAVGKVDPSTLVWTEGFPNWQHASAVPELLWPNGDDGGGIVPTLHAAESQALPADSSPVAQPAQSSLTEQVANARARLERAAQDGTDIRDWTIPCSYAGFLFAGTYLFAAVLYYFVGDQFAKPSEMLDSYSFEISFDLFLAALFAILAFLSRFRPGVLWPFVLMLLFSIEIAIKLLSQPFSPLVVMIYPIAWLVFLFAFLEALYFRRTRVTFRSILRMGETKFHQSARNFMKFVATGSFIFGVIRNSLEQGAGQRNTFWPIIMIPIAAGWAYESLLRASQIRKNEWLSKNYQDIVALGESTPIFLFLRSFKAAKVIDPVKENIESDISEFVSRYGFFLALGNKERSYGAAKIVQTDDKWQAEALSLMRAARLIFFLPGMTPSAKWEAAQVLSDPLLRGKTVWITRAESETSFFFFKSAAYKDWSAFSEWVEKNFNIKFPQYLGARQMFGVEASNKVTGCHPTEEVFALLEEFRAKMNPSNADSQGDLLSAVWWRLANATRWKEITSLRITERRAREVGFGIGNDVADGLRDRIKALEQELDALSKARPKDAESDV